MVRIEIIANHSVEENILEAFSGEGVGKFYTKYPNVFGIGNSGPRMGDAVWPEENFALIIWCEEDEARGIARAVAAVKKQFPDEGIRIFGIPAEPGRFPHVMAAEPARPPAHAEAHQASHAAPQQPIQAVYAAPPPSYAPQPAAPAAPPVPETAPQSAPVYTQPAAPVAPPVPETAPPAAPVYTQP
ncbi:MAG: hypothetical protein LBB77_06545, partial [Treponema sp.]|nr:hypothetical protein [Treponema sp.]